MKRLAFLALALACSLGPESAFAQSPLIDGQITKVDQSAGKITIKHGAAKKLGMDAGMTMVYKVQDPAMLAALKAGDKIKPEQKADMQRVENQKHNAAIDQLQSVADRFNEQVKVFRAKSADAKKP